ncbi:MAG: hypothetical protein AB7T22_13225 [Calditrichaceae bacterium]
MKSVILLFLLTSFLLAQGIYKKTYQISDDPENVFNGYLYGNGIVDLVANDSTIIAATGYGLSISHDFGNYWRAYSSKQYISKGGVAAMAFTNDSTFWISTAFDTAAQGEDLPAGGGLSYTRNGGNTWTNIPQPVDPVDLTEYSPTTTPIYNVTYDIAALDSVVWITSWAGGLRKSADMGNTWTVRTIDGQPFRAANDNVIHLAFSVITENGNLWVGTAGGIGKSADGGETWQVFTHENQENPISGNFVVALAHQEFNNTIWAATIESDPTSEVRAVSKTSNGGLSWDVMLPGIFAHNFAFDGPRIYVAADEGLFISEDDGYSWYVAPPVRDTSTGEEILLDEYYSVAVQKSDSVTRLWLGSADGIAVTADNGNTWKVVRSFVSTKTRKDPEVYAYPSPFSPARNGYIRFQYDITETIDVEIKVYNFAMEEVVTIRDNQSYISTNDSDRSTKWDGRDNDGEIVASGVYFFRAKIGGKVSWGKLVVIN